MVYCLCHLTIASHESNLALNFLFVYRKIVDVSHRNLYDAVTYKLDFIESPSAGWPFRLYIQVMLDR